MTEKYFIEVENDESVAAIHHKVSSNKWVFFCHGFGSNKDGSYEKRCERAVEEGFNAVRFDFRGNGESDGRFVDQNLSSKIEDLNSVIEFFGPQKYILFGMSFGGKVVVHSTERLHPEALILKSPVTYNSIMDKFKSVVEEKGSYTHFEDKTIDQRFVDDLETYNFSKTAKNIDCPVALFHGLSDSTVHPEKSWKAAKEFQKDIRVEMYENEKHRMSADANQRLLDSMFFWLNSIR